MRDNSKPSLDELKSGIFSSCSVGYNPNNYRWWILCVGRELTGSIDLAKSCLDISVISSETPDIKTCVQNRPKIKLDCLFPSQ